MAPTETPEARSPVPGRAFSSAFLQRDRTAVEATLAEDVKLRSPIISTPFEGKREVLHVLGVVRDCFEELSIVSELSDDDTIMLSFAARIGDQPLRGVDIVRLDREGRVAELTIQVRPLIGLTTLTAAIAGSLSRPRGLLWALLARALIVPLRVFGFLTDRLGARMVLGRYRPTW